MIQNMSADMSADIIKTTNLKKHGIINKYTPIAYTARADVYLGKTICHYHEINKSQYGLSNQLVNTLFG
jgi:hypothetical protein